MAFRLASPLSQPRVLDPRMGFACEIVDGSEAFPNCLYAGLSEQTVWDDESVDMEIHGVLPEGSSSREQCRNGGSSVLAQIEGSVAFHHQVDLRLNYMWTPELELETLKTTHFAIVLPKLRSLVSQHAPHSLSVRLEDDNPYSRAYMGLLVVALSNNLAGLDDFPVESMFDYIKTRFTTKQMMNYFNTLPKLAFQAFAESFIRCAVLAGDVPLVEFVLSIKDCDLDPSSLLEYTMGRGDIAMAKFLIKHGAKVNDTIWKRFCDNVLYSTTRGKLNNPDYLSVLLASGVNVTEVTMLSLLEGPRLHEYSQIIERLLPHVDSSEWDAWKIYEILLVAVVRLPKQMRYKIAKIILRRGIDLNLCMHTFWHEPSLSSLPEPRPDRILDAAVCVGDLDLVRLFRDSGAEVSPSTLPLAVRSNNYELTRYLIYDCEAKSEFATSDLTMLDVIPMTSLDILPLLEWHSAWAEACRDRRYCIMVSDASKAGDTDVVRKLLKNVFMEQKKSEAVIVARSRTMYHKLAYILMEAIAEQREELVRILVQGGICTGCYWCARLFEKEYDYSLPLLAALAGKNASIVRTLLDAGTQPVDSLSKRHQDYDVSSLQLACEWGDQSIIEDLLYAGADLNHSIKSTQPGSPSPLTIAVQSQNAELVRFLLQAGAHPNVEYEPERDILRVAERCITPLRAAVRHSDHEMIELLLEYGADPADSFALLDAVDNGAVDTVQLLLHHAIKRHPKGKSQFGTAAIQSAIHSQQINTVRLLVEGKVDIRNIPAQGPVDTDLFVESPLATAIRLDFSPNRDIIRMLILRGVDPNSIVAHGRFQPHYGRHTGLLAAIRHDNITTVETLLRFGADVNWPAVRGLRRTPLQYACELGRIDIVQLLLEKGAVVNAAPAVRGGATALQLAAIGGFVGIAELLLAWCADINAPTAAVNGRSPIDGAAEHGRFHMVNFLLQQGAVLMPKGIRGDCEAINLATRNGHKAVAEFLRSYLDNLRKHEGCAQRIEPTLDHSTQTSRRPACQQCNLDFSNSSSLARHVRTKHSNTSARKDQRHECGTCHMVFKRKDTLQRHFSTHAKTMHVSCHTCRGQFRKDYFKHFHLDEHGRCKKASTSIASEPEHAPSDDDAMTHVLD